MPVSPYTGQLYSGYTTGRPYSGSSTATIFASNPTTSYKLSTCNSSSALKTNTPSATPTFLFGNTATLKKNFSKAGESSLPGDCKVSYNNNVPSAKRNQLGPSFNCSGKKETNINNVDRGSTSSRKFSLIDVKEENPSKGYKSRYDTRSQAKENEEEGKNYRVKDIDASTINVSGKPPKSSAITRDFRKRDIDGNSISRNRQVVRLTIKREKEKEKNPFIIPENSVKTIAQKLFEKYTIHEKKKENPLAFVPRNRLLTGTYTEKLSTPNVISKPPKPLDCGRKQSSLIAEDKKSCTLKKDVAKHSPKRKLDGRLNLKNDDGNDGDDELSDNESSCKNGDEDAAQCFRRATKAATNKEELECPEDIKDAIVAVMLHPGIDIESDEEIKMLINEDSDNKAMYNKGKRKSKETKESLETKTFKMRKKSDAELDGEILVDRLRRFVKHQVSIKKESEIQNSGISSPEKNVSTPSYTIVKPNERIIPIILQDDDRWSHTEQITNEVIKKENESNQKAKISKIKMADGKTDKNFPNLLNKETQFWDNSEKCYVNFSLTLNGKETIRKSQEKNHSKLFESTYQNIPNEATSALPEAFPIFPQESGEHSIAHPENKVSATSLFITDSVSDLKKSEKEFLSFDSKALEKEKKLNNVNNKTNLKGTKNAENTIIDYKNGLEKNEDNKSSKFQSKLDNSIKEKSYNLKEGGKRRNFDKDELKSNYSLSNEETPKEFGETKIESGKSCLKERSSITHFEDDAKKIGGWTKESSVSDIKEIGANKSNGKFDQVELENSKGSCEGFASGKGMSKNSDSNITSQVDLYCLKETEEGKKGKNNNKNKNKSVEEDFKLSSEKNSQTQNLLTKSKKTFLLHPIGDKILEPNIKSKYELQKSATTQIVSESDAESMREGFKFCQDIEIKPSLRQFLEETKSAMNEATEEQVSSTRPASSSICKSLSMSDVGSKAEDDKAKKIKILPKQNLLPLKEEKPAADDSPSKKKIWKKPVKPTNERVIQVIKKPEEIKPKRVWKRPEPIKEKKPQDEIFKVLNQLRRPAASKFPPNKKEKANEDKASVKENKEKEKEKSIRIETKKSPNQTVNEDKDEEIPKDGCNPNANSNDTKHWFEIESPEIEEDVKLANTISPNSDEGTEEAEVVNVTLSTSQSADSAYGSSPSTPQPRTTLQADEKQTSSKKKSSDIKEENETPEEFKNDTEETCELCGTNCHKKCEKQMPNLCGVNQKLLAEALSSVKKGPSPDGKDVSRTLNPVSATKSCSSVSSTEGETTTTEDDETDTDSTEFSGPAEIRAPIKTRPKYRKYNIVDFNFIKVLGKGSFGKVMLAQQIDTENYFAVKCLKKDVVLEDNDVECCLIERKVLTLGTKHPYLCHLFCSFQTPSHLFFVMEYLTGGDLMFHIQRVGRFDEYRSCFYAAEIISGLKFLHNKGIIYRDLKLDNILLDYEGHIRIADFGMCKLQIYLDRFADTFCGTPDYMAPEVIKGLHYNQCVDWWSFGVLLYEMMIGKSPFKGCDEDHLFWLICNEEPFYPRYLSREAQSILKQLLDKDATRRLGPPYSPHGEIKCHAFFKYVDWNKIERKEVVTPYKPKLRHILDVQYFDRLFTKRNAAITPLDASILETMDQTPFKDFSYTNPNITD